MSTRTLAACLTGRAAAALATIAVRGPNAWQIVRGLVRPISASGRQLPEQPESGRFWVGRFSEDPQTAAGDEVVVAAKRGAADAWVEIHCHGGPEVVRWLMEALERRGAELCSALELETASTSPEKAIASAALAEAPTLRTAAILLDQLHGALATHVDQAIDALAHGRLADAEGILRGLLRHAAVGCHLTTPWRVAIVGAPNVGKSSLVNALAGYQRSIVSPTPGTTRDVVSTLIAVDGWPVELLDTAGWRDADEDLEQQGVERARAAAASADLRLWVLDASALPQWPTLDRPPSPPSPLPPSVGEGGKGQPSAGDSSPLLSSLAPRPSSLAPSLGFHFVINKIDLPPAWDLNTVDAVRVSARTGEGIDALIEALSRWLVAEPPQPGDAVPFTPALVTRLQVSLDAVIAGRAEDAERMLRSVWDDDVGLAGTAQRQIASCRE